MMGVLRSSPPSQCGAQRAKRSSKMATLFILRRKRCVRVHSRYPGARGHREPLAPRARKLGIAAGGPIRLATRRCAIELKLWADGAVPSGVVVIPFCYVEAATNILADPGLDPFGKIPEFKYCAARMEAVGNPGVTLSRATPPALLGVACPPARNSRGSHVTPG